MANGNGDLNQEDIKRLKILKRLLDEIGSSSNKIVKTLDSGLTINNLDEVKAAVANQFIKFNKSLTNLFMQLNTTAKKQQNFLDDIAVVLEQMERKSHKKPTLSVNNFDEIKFPKNTSVDNLKELKPLFESVNKAIKDNFNIKIPQPKVDVKAPIVNVPETRIDIPPVDFSPLIKVIANNLNKLSTNSKTRPLAVRLTDGQEWIKELTRAVEEQRIAFQGFQGQIGIKDKKGNTINPLTEETYLANLGGGGTEYTEGDTDATITGKAMLGEAPSDTLQVLQLDASKHLQIDIAADSAGLATSSNQLPDGHNVTVDNGAGVAAVNIQDGGNTITVDGTVSVNQPVSVDDNASSLTVDTTGTSGLEVIQATAADLNVTEASAATIATNTGNIDTNTTNIPNVIGTDGAAGPSNVFSVGGTESGGAIQELRVDSDGHLQMDVLSSALPTGAATAANQTTIIGHVDGLEGLLTTIDADTSTLAAVDYATQTTLAVIAGDTTSLDGKDLMLGTDFSNVMGTGSLRQITQADNVANTQDALFCTNFNMVFDGTTWDRLRGDSTDGALVNLGANNDVTVTSGSITVQEPLSVDDNGSSLTVDTTGTSGLEVVQATAADLNVTEASAASILTSVQIMDDWDEVHDAAVGSDGALVMMEAKTFDGAALPNAVNAEGDAVRPAATESGVQYVFLSNPDGSKSLAQEEDVAHSSADLGVMSLGVRVDGNAVARSGTSGDYEPLQLYTTGALKIIEHGLNGFPNFYSNVLGVYNIPTMAVGDPTLGTLATVANNGLYVTGDEAHDAADAGNPIKIGVHATDYEPDASDQPSGNETEVAANDRANVASNRFGEVIEGVNPYFFTLDNVSTTYNNTTTTATSTAKECWNYRQATIAYELDKANTPTDILFEVEVSLDGTNYTTLTNNALGHLIYDDTAVGSGIEESYTFPIACQRIRLKATATGTDASNTFTVANAVLYLRN